MKLKQILESINLRENSGAQIPDIIESSAYKELQQKVPQNIIDQFSKILQLFDNKVDKGKTWDREEMYDLVQGLDSYFPIDTVNDFMEYLTEYIRIVEDNMKNPPTQLIAKINSFISKYK